mmetsp:Transcript_26208/g.55305  ORF Transcript_26208/g.55305 Transcript_26208/m.55305 type:complete len:522 (-) Transcript_26208:281-1846(-)
MAQKSDGTEDFDISPSHSLEDDRKPPPESNVARAPVEKSPDEGDEKSPHMHHGRETHDHEPPPLNEIDPMLVLSSSASTAESTKGTNTSAATTPSTPAMAMAMARKAAAKEYSNLSPPPSLEDDRKPPADSSYEKGPLKGMLKLESPPTPQGILKLESPPEFQQDRDSFPFNEGIDPNLVLSSSASTTESPKGTNAATASLTPAISRKGTSKVGINLSPPSSLEDDRKRPPDSSSTGQAPLKGILKLESPPTTKGILKLESPPSPKPQVQHDYEPVPLNKIDSMPGLSLSTHPSTEENPSQTPYSTAATHVGQTSSQPGVHSDPYATPTQAAASITHSIPQSTPPMMTRGRRRALYAPTTTPGSATGAGEGEGGAWERRFNELVDFKRMHGHCDVPQNYTQNTSLGTWVNKQRMEQKNRSEEKTSSLNDSRLERLESIGFRWAKRKGQASWDAKFNELVAYKAKFGNCNVPTKYRDNSTLGRWVSTQRAEYKKYQEGQKTSMNADRIRRLDGIGFAWFINL